MKTKAELPERLIVSGDRIYGNGHDVAVVHMDYHVSGEAELEARWKAEREMAAELVRRYNQYPELLARIAVLEEAQNECK